MRPIDADKLMQGLYVIRDRETGIPRSLVDWFLSMVNEAPTIQPQGIDKERLIEELEEQYKNLIPEDDWDYCKIRQIKADIKVVNRQPTSDGWIPVSEQPPKEPCVYTVEDYSPYTVAKYGEPQRKFLKTLPLGLEMYERIVAWKPVEPQPYKGSE